MNRSLSGGGQDPDARGDETDLALWPVDLVGLAAARLGGEVASFALAYRPDRNDPFHEGFPTGDLLRQEESVVQEADTNGRLALAQDRPASLSLAHVRDPRADENRCVRVPLGLGHHLGQRPHRRKRDSVTEVVPGRERPIGAEQGRRYGQKKRRAGDRTRETGEPSSRREQDGLLSPSPAGLGAAGARVRKIAATAKRRGFPPGPSSGFVAGGLLVLGHAAATISFSCSRFGATPHLLFEAP